MKCGLIIYSREDANKNKWFIDYCLTKLNNHAYSLKLVLEEDVKKIAEDCHYDYAIYRGRDWCVVSFLEEHGVRVFNNSLTSKTANDKYLTYLFAKRIGVDVVETYNSFSEILSYPFVMKTVSGHGGKEVFLINDTDECTSLLNRYKDKSFLYQPFLDNDGDLRVYVIGKKVIASVLRKGGLDFRHNYSLGGQVELTDTPKELEKIVVKIAELLNSDYIGVDFLKTKDGGYLLNEIEDPVGARMLYSVSKIEILDIFVNYIIEKVQ